MNDDNLSEFEVLVKGIVPSGGGSYTRGIRILATDLRAAEEIVRDHHLEHRESIMASFPRPR